jgi:hypothetical protein
MLVFDPLKHKHASHPGGFTLAEVMVAVGCLAVFVSACFSSILFNRLALMKAKEEAIALDFLIHYAETVKGLPFEQVVPGYPISPLLDGQDGAPNIRIPGDDSWVAVNTPDYEAFHPDLLWVHNRHPTMRVHLATQILNGAPHDTYLNIKLAWDPPLNSSNRLQVQLDLMRNKDL